MLFNCKAFTFSSVILKGLGNIIEPRLCFYASLYFSWLLNTRPSMEKVLNEFQLTGKDVKRDYVCGKGEKMRKVLDTK